MNDTDKKMLDRAKKAMSLNGRAAYMSIAVEVAEKLDKRVEELKGLLEQGRFWHQGDHEGCQFCGAGWTEGDEERDTYHYSACPIPAVVAEFLRRIA